MPAWLSSILGAVLNAVAVSFRWQELYGYDEKWMVILHQPYGIMAIALQNCPLGWFNQRYEELSASAKLSTSTTHYVKGICTATTC